MLAHMESCGNHVPNQEKMVDERQHRGAVGLMPRSVALFAGACSRARSPLERVRQLRDQSEKRS